MGTSRATSQSPQLTVRNNNHGTSPHDFPQYSNTPGRPRDSVDPSFGIGGPASETENFGTVAVRCMPEIIDILNVPNPRDVIHRSVAMLAEGALVGLTTECTYVLVAHSLQERSVEALAKLRDSDSQTILALCLKGHAEAHDFLPEMSPLAKRIGNRCWPGPVTMMMPVQNQCGLLQALPRNTIDAVVSRDEVPLYVPAGEIIREILHLLPAPLVLFSEARRNPAAISAESLGGRYGDAATLIVDSGPSRFGQSPTIVRVKENRCEVIHPGIIDELTLKRMASNMYLFVCTGNTCRSPMAEAIFRKTLAEKLQCQEEELDDRGFVALSAGLAAESGAPASTESVAVLDSVGIDLRAHASQPLTDRLLEQIDFIYAMTQSHRDSILSIRPDFADRVELLSREGTDISDPFGGTRQDYERCRAEIERNVSGIVDEIVAGGLR